MGKRVSVQEHFGARVRALRLARGLTQQQLAERVEMDWKNLGTIERGQRNVTLGIVARLAEGLAVEPLQLFMFDRPGIAQEEDIAAAWLTERLRSFEPRSRALMSAIFRQIVRLAEAERELTPPTNKRRT